MWRTLGAVAMAVGVLAAGTRSEAGLITTTPSNTGTLDFGKVLVGTMPGRVKAISATNLTGNGLKVSFSAPQGGGGAFGGGSTNNAAVGARKSTSMNYTYAPTVRGLNQAYVTVSASSTPQNQTDSAKIFLQGQGVAPVAAMSRADRPMPLLARIGESTSTSLVVQNNGDGNLSGLGTVSDLRGSVSGPVGSSAFSGAGASVDLMDGKSASVVETFTPTDRTLQTAVVTGAFVNGSTDGRNQAQNLHVDLSGQGVSPTFGSSVDPSSTMDFGTIHPGGSSSLSLDLTNLSTDENYGDLHLTALSLLGFTISGPDASEFSLLGFATKALDRGEHVELLVRFLGTTLGQRHATLSFLTDQGAAFGQAGQSFRYDLVGELKPFSITPQASPVPEPSTMALAAIAGAIGLAARARRRRRV